MMYIKLCFIFVLITIASVTISVNQDKFRYDYNYHPEIDGWLKLHRVPATWRDARMRCDLEGAVLASPINVKMGSVLRKIMKGHRYKRNGTFSGIHATFSKGYFNSIEGVPLNRIPVEWMPTEPNNKNDDENCIMLIGKGTIADVNCNDVLPYICYKNKTSDMIFNDCGTVDKEYHFEPRTESCYKFHRVAKNWTQAFKTCAAEGAYLAIVNSRKEANVLKELFEKHPRDSLVFKLRDIMRDIIHIGFHDWGERGIWTTIHGTPLTEVGYNIFSETQPDNAAPGEYCGGMWRNGRLNDVWCHERGPFICEKDPDSLDTQDDLEENI